MRIGRLGMLIDNSSIASPLAIDFGLDTADVMNTDIFGTDGTPHATITVAAGSPGAILASAPLTRNSERFEGLDRAVLRAIRTTPHLGAVDAMRDASTDTVGMRGTITLRAVRRSAALEVAVDSLLKSQS
jgi:hypothetical protein